jgi:hypothetical protein
VLGHQCSAAIFETGPKAATTPVAPAVPRVVVFSTVNRR